MIADEARACVVWALKNAHSMRDAIYDAHKMSREPAKRYETVTDFEVDDG